MLRGKNLSYRSSKSILKGALGGCVVYEQNSWRSVIVSRLPLLALLVTLLAVPCSATVIGNFEGDMQGWYVPGNPNVSLQYATLGATLDSVSLRIQTQAGGWQDAMALDLVGQDDLMATFLQEKLLAVDVTRFASDWQGDPPDGYTQVFMVINAGGAGWDVWEQQVAGDWIPDQGDQTQTLVFDIASAMTQIRIHNLWWFDVRLVVHSHPGYAPGGRVYVDNIRLLSQRPKRVIWVSETSDVDQDTVQDDQGWVKMLRSAGYDVEVTLDHWKTLDSGRVDQLNAADLVIMSRACFGGAYATDFAEVLQWNALKTPLIQMSAHVLRQDQWKWINNSSLVNLQAPMMRVDAPDHPVLSQMNLNQASLVEVLDAGVGPTASDTSFPSSTVSGHATLLASTALGNAWMAEWHAGTEFYEGAGQFAGGQRMMFMAGSKEVAGAVPKAAVNLTETGQQVFLGAVAYMLGFKESDPGTEDLVHGYAFDDGTARDTVGLAHGSLMGDAQILNGALVTGSQGGWIEMPGHSLGLNSFEGLTLECSYTPSAGRNSGWTMLAYFGESGRVSHDYLYMTSARGDDRSSAAISIDDTTSPWDAQFSVLGPEYDDGLIHHMVVTVNQTHIALYLDGELQGMMRLDASNVIAGISPDLAYLAKSGERSDPEWVGQIHEFNIYNRALHPGEVRFLSEE